MSLGPRRWWPGLGSCHGGRGEASPSGHVKAQGTAARAGPGAGRGGKEATLVASCSLALHLPGLPRMAPVFPVALWTHGH